MRAVIGVEAMDKDKRTMLYRVVQEVLVNVANDAQASVVKVVFAKSRVECAWRLLTTARRLK